MSRNFKSQAYKKFRRHDGRELDLEITYSLIEMEKPLLLAIYRDVGERIAAVEDLRKAKEFSENLILDSERSDCVLTDSQNRISIFNQTAENVSGFSKAEVEGRNWKDLIRIDLDDCKFEGETHSNTFDAKLKTKNGEERIVSWQSNSIFEQGECSGTICFGIDITERKGRRNKNSLWNASSSIRRNSRAWVCWRAVLRMTSIIC